MSDLAGQGFITRRQGVGSFVREDHPARQQVEGRSYMDELRQIQFGTEADVLELDLRAAPHTVAEKVGFDGETLHVLRVRRERRTGEPLIVTEAWLPAHLAEVITVEKLGHTPLYGLLAEAGCSLERVEHEITAEIAGPRAAQLLEIAIGEPMLRVNRLALVGDQPHHYLSILLAPGRSRILLSYAGDELEIDQTLAIKHDVGG